MTLNLAFKAALEEAFPFRTTFFHLVIRKAATILSPPHPQAPLEEDTDGWTTITPQYFTLHQFLTWALTRGVERWLQKVTRSSSLFGCTGQKCPSCVAFVSRYFQDRVQGNITGSGVSLSDKTHCFFSPFFSPWLDFEDRQIESE